MAKQLFANNATGYLNATITDTATSIVLQSGNGAVFPSPTGSDYFYVTLYDGVSLIEIVKVTARSTDTLTVVRGQEGTTASAFPSTSIVECRATKGTFENLLQKSGDTATTITTSNLVVSTSATAPTKTYGTNTTDVATTAFVQTALQAIYPVGSVYINAAVDTNPATLFGFGTWSAIGSGKVLVGQDTSDTAFDALGETGGSKDAVAVSHTHTFSATSGAAGSHTHTINDPGHSHTAMVQAGSYSHTVGNVGDQPYYTMPGSVSASGTGISINAVADHTHSVSGTTGSTGSSGTNANLQPYLVVKMWQRTA